MLSAVVCCVVGRAGEIKDGVRQLATRPTSKRAGKLSGQLLAWRSSFKDAAPVGRRGTRQFTSHTRTNDLCSVFQLSTLQSLRGVDGASSATSGIRMCDLVPTSAAAAAAADVSQ